MPRWERVPRVASRLRPTRWAVLPAPIVLVAEITGTEARVWRPEGEVLNNRATTDNSWDERTSRRPEVLPTFESRKVRRAGTGISGGGPALGAVRGGRDEEGGEAALRAGRVRDPDLGRVQASIRPVGCDHRDVDGSRRSGRRCKGQSQAQGEDGEGCLLHGHLLRGFVLQQIATRVWYACCSARATPHTPQPRINKRGPGFPGPSRRPSWLRLSSRCASRRGGWSSASRSSSPRAGAGPCGGRTRRTGSPWGSCCWHPRTWSGCWWCPSWWWS